MLNSYDNFAAMQSGVSTIIILGFAVTIGVILFQLARSGAEWMNNNESPIITAEVKIVAKRMAVSRHTHSTGEPQTMHDTTSSTYFVTFEQENGDRIELKVPDKEYGLLVEGDRGELTYQGTWYKGFARNRGL